MKDDGIERALDLLDHGIVSYEPLSLAEADAILEGRTSIEELIRTEINLEAIRLFAEVGLAKLGVATSGLELRELLERLRREERAAALAKVAREPLELWSAGLVRRGQQILGRESLSEVAREVYLEALRAGLPSADAISQRFGDLLDEVGVRSAKHDGIEAATRGRASSKKLAFLKARVSDGTMEPTRFDAWARDQYLIAMYGRSVRAGLAVSLAAHVDMESITDHDIGRGRARDLLVEPTQIEREDLSVIDEAVALGLISKVERDEALRVAMFHQFEQGAAGDALALAFELALGFVEWSQPALQEARRRGVELELRRLAEGQISQEQMEYLEASVVRGLLKREELDQARTAAYLELRFGASARPEAAVEMRGWSQDSAWLERLPAKKPCWVGDVDLGAKLRVTLGAQATAFARIAESIIEWLPLFPEPAQLRASFDALVSALDDTKVSSLPVERIRSFPPEVVRVAMSRARAIVDAVAPMVRPMRAERRAIRRAQSGPRLAVRAARAK
jgi:hypothetical protein